MNKIEEIFKSWKISFNPDDKQSNLGSFNMNDAAKELFERYKTIENEIRILQEDKKNLLEEKVVPIKIFQLLN